MVVAVEVPTRSKSLPVVREAPFMVQNVCVVAELFIVVVKVVCESDKFASGAARSDHFPPPPTAPQEVPL